MNKIIHDPQKLLESLVKLPRETGWVEFKENKFNEESVGQYVSSLSNSAMLEGKDAAYLVFGVRNSDHAIVGTSVDLLGGLVGSESFIFWLNKNLDPKINITPESFEYDGKKIEILCIDPGYIQPVKFKKISYIRIDTSQQSLSNYPERERMLWHITSQYSFENTSLSGRYSQSDIVHNFDYDSLIGKIKGKRASYESGLAVLQSIGLVKDDLQGKYEVSTLLAISCARNLNLFSPLENKGLRLIVYKNKDKMDAKEDIEGRKGYLVAFAQILSYIMTNIPSNEEMLHGIRKKVYRIPEIAIREFLANAIVHQDFTQTGSRPLVEIFRDKVRITNPGMPLVSVDRFIDTPSKSRNPRFAKLMRDAGICEERGSGVDRALREIEKAALPPPSIEALEGCTVVTIFMPKKFDEMTIDERVRACFQHACLSHESGEPMTISSFRERLGLSQKQMPQVREVITSSVEAGRIRILQSFVDEKDAQYVPYYV